MLISVTLITFRFLPLSWITYGLYEDKRDIESVLILMAVIFLTIIFSVSSVLLYRVATTDYNFIIALDIMKFIGINSNKFQCKCSSKLRKILWINYKLVISCLIKYLRITLLLIIFLKIKNKFCFSSKIESQ